MCNSSSIRLLPPACRALPSISLPVIHNIISDQNCMACCRSPLWKSKQALINSHWACVADAGWEASCCWHPSPYAHPTQRDELYSMDRKSENWTVPVTSKLSESLPSVSFCHHLLLSRCLSMTLYLSFHLSPFPLCVALCHAFLSAPAPFIGPCHWAMCAVPVSKTPGRLSSFPCWRMQGQHGSCESYRLGSVKALPVGKLFPPAF